ncbi:hypothetical protein DSL72_004689 [Monilinia vaccinii-corymbosi]|uniref:Alpha/beta hydrolase fold-3 domain-containing protein n=1 Tax=Monilinia vaccinii-corymbosi TaxID=61207 RepID=A0A8A3P902_9HELO|nr:hypothetical protein DSL72_004689 [Monilinia vaccinii-corymbosi]
MDTASSALSLAKLILPKMPMIGKTILSHSLGISPNSNHWDLKTELTVNVLRSLTHATPHSISQTQASTLHDPGIKGKTWIAKVTLAAPAEDDARQQLFRAIEDMKEEGSPRGGGFDEPALRPVEAEWTGHRAGATKDSKRLCMPESQHYTEMMKEVSAPTTILYMHGGAHWLLDPASYRVPLTKLARLTGGRVLSLRYRLAPQHPFPAALLDCLVAYLNLLFPPPDALHAPVPPEHIILSGDSAGGNLALSLLLLLLHWHRSSTCIIWNGTAHRIPLPAGLALNSPWTDLLRSSPSNAQPTNLQNDYIPPPTFSPVYPPCPLWPTSPPRPNIYSETPLLLHPLVSPLAAPTPSWAQTPPILFQTGTELLTDESKILAARIVRAGASVRWEQYDMMPHCFALVLPHLEASKRCFEGWAGFCREVVGLGVGGEEEREREREREQEQGKEKSPAKTLNVLRTSGKKFSVKSLQETQVDVAGLWDESDQDVLERMRESLRVLE